MACRAWSALIASAAIACGGGAASTPKPGEGTEGSEAAFGEQDKPAEQRKVDIEAMFARESEAPSGQQLVNAPDGSVKARLEAPAPPQVSNEEGFVMISAPLAEHTIQCFVYPEGKDGGEVARVLIGASLDKVVAADKRQWIDVHGDQVAGWPYLVARAHYLFQSERGTLAGDFKLGVSVRDETTVACMLDGAGYYATFERVMRSLLGELVTPQNRAIKKPSYVEITRAALPARMVVLSRTTVTQEAGKDVRASTTMQLMIGPEGTLRTSDEASVEKSKKGRVVEAVYASASMGHADHRIELSSKGDKYSVSGTLQDKPLASEFTVAGGLPDEERSKAVVCSVRDGKAPQAELLGYEPSVDPQKASSITVQKSATPDAHVVVTIGASRAVEMRVKVDEDCDVEGGTIVAGPATFPIERLWHEQGKR